MLTVDDVIQHYPAQSVEVFSLFTVHDLERRLALALSSCETLERLRAEISKDLTSEALRRPVLDRDSPRPGGAEVKGK